MEFFLIRKLKRRFPASYSAGPFSGVQKPTTLRKCLNSTFGEAERVNSSIRSPSNGGEEERVQATGGEARRKETARKTKM
jgi:hypothetical protein